MNKIWKIISLLVVILVGFIAVQQIVEEYGALSSVMSPGETEKDTSSLTTTPGETSKSHDKSIEEIKKTSIQDLSYDELMRDNEDYIGETVYYQGEVAQVNNIASDEYVLRVNVTKGEYGMWENDVWINYQGERILKEDIIDLWGKIEGIKKYTTVLGSTRSIPELNALHLEVVEQKKEKSKAGTNEKSPSLSRSTPTCEDECSHKGQKKCEKNSLQVCGNYNVDDCLEWKTDKECKHGCSNGFCIIPIGYSRNKPAPIGKSLVVEEGGFGEVSKNKVTLLEVKRGKNAWEVIKEANQFNEAAPSGFEYILVKVQFKYLKTPSEERSYMVSPMDFTAVSSEGKDYGFTSIVEPEPELEANLYEGASHTGWITFQVAEDDEEPLMVFGRKYNGTGGIWFKLYKN